VGNLLDLRGGRVYRQLHTAETDLITLSDKILFNA
jgi:hypothetical protein